MHCRSPHTNRCTAIREQQGLGYLPGRDGAAQPQPRADPPLHGHVDLCRVAVIPEIALAKVGSRGAPSRLCAVRLWALDGNRRGALHGQGRARLDLRRLRLRPRRARLRDRLQAGGRRSASSRSTCPRSASPRLVTTAPPTRASPAEDTVDWIRGGDRRLRRRLHVRGDRARRRDGSGRRGRARSLGSGDHVRRRRQGRDARRRAAPVDHRPTRRRAPRSAASRAGPQVPQLVDRWLAGEIDVDRPRDRQGRTRRRERRLRCDGAAGGHPHRGSSSREPRARPGRAAPHGASRVGATGTPTRPRRHTGDARPRRPRRAPSPSPSTRPPGAAGSGAAGRPRPGRRSRPPPPSSCARRRAPRSSSSRWSADSPAAQLRDGESADERELLDRRPGRRAEENRGGDRRSGRGLQRRPSRPRPRSGARRPRRRPRGRRGRAAPA